MKKFLFPALAVLLCMGLFTACQGGGAGTISSAAGSGDGQSTPSDSSQPPVSPAPLPAPPDSSSVQTTDPRPDPGDVQEPGPEQDPEPGQSTNTKLYVLMYHHFIKEGQEYNNWMLTDTRLREDLQWMADHGWTTVLPSELAAGKPLPEKAVMLTFDDGYDSNYTLAYPLLQEFQAKAVISIIVKPTDDQSPGSLTWDMCREMAQSGLVEIGSHTYNSHAGESGITRQNGETREEYEARILPDLQASIDLIQANVGVKPLLFAYPNGLKESWAAGFIQEHFAITVTTKHGPSDISKGLYSLNRCNVSMGVPVSEILPA